MLTTQEALAELERLEQFGLELLGLDGFRLQPDGRYMAPLDLIIDFTSIAAPNWTPDQKFAEARRFMVTYDSPQTRWEIVSGSQER